MICPNCEVDHTQITKDWPCNWPIERRLRFANALTSLGVGPGFLPAMACEVEKLINLSVYEVSEVELIRYMTESAAIAQRLARVESVRDAMLVWSKRITKPFSFTTSDSRGSIYLKLSLLAVIGPPMLILTTPIRMPFMAIRWWVGRKLHPYFTGWLKQHGKKKC